MAFTLGAEQSRGSNLISGVFSLPSLPSLRRPSEFSPPLNFSRH